MTVMVALLRGVNVGGASVLKMAELRDVAAECGYTRVRTYIQSGNLVFASPTDRTGQVAADLGRAIAARADITPAVAVRTRPQVEAAIDRNPFRARGEDPAHLHVVFLTGGAAGDRSGDPLASIDLAAFAPEEAVVDGSQIYLFLPGGVGRSKLAAAVGRSPAATGTMRNWRTVTKLAELAAEVEVDVDAD